MTQQPQKKKRKKQSICKYNPRLRGLVLGILIVGIGFGSLVTKLYQLQIVNGNDLKTAANAQQIKDTVLQPTRGSILDAQGRVLAKTAIVWNIEAGPNIIASRDKNKEQKALAKQLAVELSPILNIPEEELFAKLGDYDSYYKILARGVDKPVADKVTEIARKYKIGQGISCSSTTKREYPYGNFMSSVLGFVNSEGHGTITGVEVSYDKQLAGREGRRISARNRLDGEMATENAMVYPAEDGNDVMLTIDSDIQAVVEKNLNGAVLEHNPQNRATAIVMDVNTGAILAMATKPDFDPNQPSTILNTEQYNAIMAIPDEQQRTQALGDARSILWRNKAISEVYDPGSVFKVITTSAGLDAGVVNQNTTYTCQGHTSILGQNYVCLNRTAHGVVNISDILKQSCNVGTIGVGQALGVDKFSAYFNAYGLTGLTGIDLPNEARSIYHKSDNMSLVDLASSSFGQGMALTPLQMISGFSAAVNGGKLVTPHVVQRVQDKNGNIVQEIIPQMKRQVISEEVSQQMREYLERVVKGDASDNYYSSARFANVYGYRVGGKSGTSDNLKGDDSGFVSSFLGVAPINNPQVAVLVVIDTPLTWTDLTTYIAVPVAGNILQEVLPMLGIQPEYPQDAPQEVSVPNVTLSDTMNHLAVARAEMGRLGLQHQVIGNGQTVLHQFPENGQIPLGSCVYLYTESVEDTLVQVPDFSGLSAQQAKQVAQSGYLNIRIQGDPNGIAVSQDVAVASSVPMGKVITVTMANPPQEQSENVPNEATTE